MSNGNTSLNKQARCCSQDFKAYHARAPRGSCGKSPWRPTRSPRGHGDQIQFAVDANSIDVETLRLNVNTSISVGVNKSIIPQCETGMQVPVCVSWRI